MKKGFTFVEVLVSTIILIIVLAEMLAGFAGGRLISRRSRDRLIAQGFAREKLEELLANYSLSYSLSDGVWRQESISDQDFIRRTGVWREYKVEKIPNVDDPTKIYYLKITVVLKWHFLGPDVTYTESLSSLIYNPNYTP